MPGRNQISARRPRTAVKPRAAAAVRAGALLVIDHERLQGAAWAEFHTVRKRLDKASRDLHGHEEIDAPAYDSWLHRAFPVLVTTLRELHAEVAAKARKIQTVQMIAAYAGGSLKRLWREQKAREANPEAFEDESESSPDEADDNDNDSTRRRHEARFDDFERAPGPKPSLDARAIYRRLVQRLHPDRGGEWTPARERLWHEVQQAWSTADTDWLSRLEIDWEEAHEIVGPTSPLSRLRRAIEELHAARRDTERKLRDYRGSPPWRFTKNEKHRASLHRKTEENFAHDIRFLQRQLDHLNATIAAWEEDWRQDKRSKSRHRPGRRD